MKIAVLGAGLMGKEVARDLVRCEKVEAVALADIDKARAELVCSYLPSPKLQAFSVDASQEEELISFIKNYNVVINALFYRFNERIAKAAIAANVHAVDLGGHIGQVTDKVLMYSQAAKKAHTTVIPDLGVAPGMINILAGYGVGKLDKVEKIKMYVGGIPVQPEPPLEYNHVFSMEGVLDHYTDPALIIRDGKVREVPSLSEVEQIYFDKFGPLEAFHTAGGTSTLLHSFPHVKELEYKTIRYRGHAEKFKLLVDLNLTRRDYEVTLNGSQIKPREVLLKVLDPIVALKGKDDVVLLRVIVSGEKDHQKRTYEYEMQTFKDNHHHVTAMAKATAYSISVVAQMIANGTINKRGVYPPEQIVPGQEYMSEMAKRGVIINERER